VWEAIDLDENDLAHFSAEKWSIIKLSPTPGQSGADTKPDHEPGDREQFIQLKVCMLYGETSPIGYAWCFAPCYGTWN